MRPSQPAWLVPALIGAVVVALLFTFAPRTSAPQPSSLPLGAIPWTDATLAPSPAPEPPDPLSLPGCIADDLALAAGGWGGATGSLAGGAVVVNVSASACRVGGTPALALFAKAAARSA